MRQITIILALAVLFGMVPISLSYLVHGLIGAISDHDTLSAVVLVAYLFFALLVVTLLCIVVGKIM